MTTLSLDPGFTTPAMAAVFSSDARIRAMCRFEAALAEASADAGLFDAAVAGEIAVACDDGVEDAAALLAAGWEAGTPVLPLLEALRGGLSEVAAASLHHGATTQDVVDTGLMLQAGEGMTLLRSQVADLAGQLRPQMVAHRATPATGWTFLQTAVPLTIGLRVAGWLSPLVEHAAALRREAADLPLQLGGPVGTLDALGDAAGAVQAGAAHRLGLRLPALAWHTDRTPILRVVGLLGRMARTTAKIATDLALLAHDGHATMRAGGSSSMPGKHNPIDATRAVAAADACAAAAGIVSGGRPPELERGIGGWHAEWLAVPLAFQTCAASVEAIGRAVGSLTFLPDDSVDGGRTPASDQAIDRVLAAFDEELAT